ncbi:unnamed protein product [Prunus armeniaca]
MESDDLMAVGKSSGETPVRPYGTQGHTPSARRNAQQRSKKPARSACLTQRACASYYLLGNWQLYPWLT